MVDGEPEEGANMFPKRPGEQLRDARISQGLDLADIATRTRIPQRHLESIESGNYASLPSSTYAIGFAKAYARAVGLDELAITQKVRGELAVAPVHAVHTTPVYEIDDPSRTPPRGLVIGGVVVALLVVLGIGLFYGTNLFRGGSSGGVVTPVASETPAAAPTPEATPTPTAGGQVALTATDEVWVRIYDKAGTTLLMKTMTPGERFDVPPTAEGPMINIGRPDKLTVTVNGARVAPLGNGKVAIKDVPIDATSLLARPAADTPPAGVAVPAPQPSATTALPSAFVPPTVNSTSVD